MNTASLTPSQRDLIQFVSPNPRAKNTILLFSETSTHDLAAVESCFADWEALNPSAVAIDTRHAPAITSDGYLAKLLEAVSCPVLRIMNLTDDDNILDSRILGFHSLVTPVDSITAKQFFNWQNMADSIHFRLIPHISSPDDWTKISAKLPRLIWVNESLGQSIPAMIRQSGIILIGDETMRETFGLRCGVSPAPKARPT